MADDTLRVVDEGAGLFGEPWYQARVIETQMRPTRVARMLGTFKTRAEAEAALRADEQKAADCGKET